MPMGKKDLDAQYARALRLGASPEGFNLLKQAALGQNDDIDQMIANMALKTLTKEKVAAKGVEAQQQLAQGGKQTVASRNVAAADAASQLPEMLGIGRLPAPGMEAMAAAQGGVVGYADGGSVERYASQGLVLPEGYEMFEDPTSGEVYPRKKRAGLYDYGLSLQEKAQGIKSPAPVAPVAPVAPAAAPAVASAAKVVQEAPKTVQKAVGNVMQPKAAVEDPTPAQKSNLDRTLADTEKLYDFLDKKFGDQMSPIKDQLQRDREEYKNMKSENVGLALLGAAGALLKPGRTTASAIGEGLSTLGEYGMKFQPQLLAARQGISAGEIGLAQAQAQAARGNFGTAAQLVGQEQTRALQERELAAKEPLYKAQAGYYGAAAGAKTAAGGGNALGELKALQSNLQAQLKALQGSVDPASKAQAQQIQMQLQQVGQAIAQRSGIALNTGFIGGRDVGGTAFKSSLFDE